MPIINDYGAIAKRCASETRTPLWRPKSPI
jgi:hypothetical protein